MYNIIIKTQEFVDKFAQFEIEDAIENDSKKSKTFDFKKIKNGLYEIEFSKVEKKEAFKFIYNILYYSRVIENLYLNIDNLDLDIENFIIEEIDFNKEKKIKVIDLFGFNLIDREYKVNVNNNSIPAIISVFCFYLLTIDEIENKYSIIDPISNLGDIIIEAAAFHPRKAFNIKKRHSIPAKKIFNLIPPIPKLIKDNNKYLSVVQDNKIFKEQKENLNFSGQNIKISQFDIDWLDAKFQEASNDFVISFIPEFKNIKEKNKFLKEFFYQIEFIFNESICVISRDEIDAKYFKDNELQLEIEKIIEYNNINYYIYILL